jgi:hypothetical protein
MDDYVLPTEAPNLCTLYSAYLTEYDLITIQEKEILVSVAMPQEVRMWETFARVCRGLHTVTNTDGSSCWAGIPECVDEGQDLAKLSHDTQLVMDALLESIAKGGASVVL